MHSAHCTMVLQVMVLAAAMASGLSADPTAPLLGNAYSIRFNVSAAVSNEWEINE